MDGAIVLDPAANRICWANVQLMPDPTILSMETGTRHRTAERVSKQTKALVIAISERRDVVSLYIEGIKYILQDIPTVLSKANQGLATLEKYRARLDQVTARLTALEFAGSARPPRRPLGPPAGRAGDPDGGRGRALHHRARRRGPDDRDAARGDRRRRDGRSRGAGPRLQRGRRPSRAIERTLAELAELPHTRSCSTSAASPSCSATTGRLNTIDFAVTPRGYRALAGVPRLPRLVAQKIVHRFGDLETMMAASDAELEAVEGVGEARAKEIREGLRRLQEVDIVDR